MTYEEIMQAAREATEGKCSVCRECDGRVCADRIPGPGSIGDVAARNFSTWREIRLNIDTLTDVKSVDTSVRLFGRTFSLPVFAGPVGAVALHYGKKYDDAHYNDILVRSCAESGICAFTGDGVDPEVMRSACSAIAECGGCAVPTVKPWDSETVAEKTALVENSGAFAVAMDVDAAGLPFLRGKTPPAGTKTEDELRKIIDNCKNPFIVKGIMTVRGAEKAIRAGAAAIVVSNHGGRVLAQCPSTAEELPEIAKAVAGRAKVLVDGGIRSGADIFKAIALGADGVLIARPFVTAVYGGGDEGVKMYIARLRRELEDAMTMCGAADIASISRDMIRI